MSVDPKLAPPALYAWVGEDELGSGTVGIKQGMVPAGMIPLVSVDQQKLTRASLTAGLQQQARQFGKTIRLVRYEPVEVVGEIPPT